MADRITVSTELLEQVAQKLHAVQNTIDEVGNHLASVDTSRIAGGQAKLILHINGVEGATVAAAVPSLRNAMRMSGNETGALAKSVLRAAQMFTDTENAITNQMESLSSDNTGFSHNVVAITEEAPILLGAQPSITKEEYYKGCEERRKNAIDSEVARLYDKYKDKIHIGSDTGSRKEYNFTFNRIYINWQEDAKDERGEYTTYFHEVGHMVDDYTEGWGKSSSREAFSKALKNDFENYVSDIMRKNSCTRKEAYNKICLWLREDENNKSGISDLCGGLTEKKCEGIWGHPADFWSGKKEHGLPARINTEAFAHFFEASMSTDSTKLDYLLQVFPNTYKEFKKIVREKTNYGRA